MHISQLKQSKFLKKEDCGKGILVTIEGGEMMNVAGSGQPEEMKFCLNFSENVKPLACNATNLELIARITGSEDTDDWTGHQIVCYNDPTVVNKGKVTGGIRVRAPKAKPPMARPAAAAAPAPAPAAPPAEEEEDDVPF